MDVIDLFIVALIVIIVLILVQLLVAQIKSGGGMYQENYDDNVIVVKLHFTNWCPACKAFKPHWFAVKEKINGVVSNGKKIIMKENDEEKNRTKEILAYPTVTLEKNGKKYVYKPNPSLTPDKSLSNWILSF